MSEAQQRGWGDEKTVAARRKWYAQYVAFSRAATEAIVGVAEVRPGLEVLDLASGTGEPALSLAAAVGPAGRVTATDIEPGPLAIAEESAAQRGLANLIFRQADAQALLFPDQSFDRVTCRFGVMFFPDHVQALRECRRVLKPGGRAVYVAWGPSEQPVYQTTVGILLKYVQAPPRYPDAPHPFKFSEPGKLGRALEQASFDSVQEELRTIPMVWTGPPEQFWEQFTETSVAFRPLIEALSGKARDNAVREIHAAIGKYYDGRQINFPGVIILATGTRQ